MCTKQMRNFRRPDNAIKFGAHTDTLLCDGGGHCMQPRVSNHAKMSRKRVLTMALLSEGCSDQFCAAYYDRGSLRYNVPGTLHPLPLTHLSILSSVLPPYQVLSSILSRLCVRHPHVPRHHQSMPPAVALYASRRATAQPVSSSK